MSADQLVSEGAARGPAVLERGDRYWLRMLGANVAAIALTSLWVLGARRLAVDASVPRTVALFAFLQILLVPAPPADRIRRYSLRAVVALVVWVLTWATLTALGFGRA